mmetsp:Transcript_12013/g.27833  ORF Transcript_12013/g.27833 Transcript_12013/m.27833 type:complete len:273 (+) Transcript_12013:957-1775(+)
MPRWTERCIPTERPRERFSFRVLGTSPQKNIAIPPNPPVRLKKSPVVSACVLCNAMFLPPSSASTHAHRWHSSSPRWRRDHAGSTHAVHRCRPEPHGNTTRRRGSTTTGHSSPPATGHRDSSGTLAGGRRWSFYRQADDVFPANQNKAEASAFRSFFEEGGAALSQDAELLRLAEDQVKVFVEGQEGSDDRSSVVKGDTEAVLHVPKQLASFSAGHFSFLGPLLEKRNLFNSLQETFYWLFYSCVVLDASFRVLLWMDLSRIDRGFRMAISL